MLVLVVVLVVTNIAALAALVYLRYRPVDDETEPAVDRALSSHAAPAGAPPRTRQLISVEILNPAELAGTRGRVLGIASSLAPGFTRRLVYDQTAKQLRAELAARSVVADVRVHTLRPVGQPPIVAPGAATTTIESAPLNYVDDVAAVEPADPSPQSIDLRGAQPPV